MIQVAAEIGIFNRTVVGKYLEKSLTAFNDRTGIPGFEQAVDLLQGKAVDGGKEALATILTSKDAYAESIIKVKLKPVEVAVSGEAARQYGETSTVHGVVYIMKFKKEAQREYKFLVKNETLSPVGYWLPKRGTRKAEAITFGIFDACLGKSRKSFRTYFHGTLFDADVNAILTHYIQPNISIVDKEGGQKKSDFMFKVKMVDIDNATYEKSKKRY